MGALIIGSDGISQRYIYDRLLALQNLRISYERSYPGLHGLVRMLNSRAPELVFVELDEDEIADHLARDIVATAPGVAVIGIVGRTSLPNALTSFTDLLRIPCSDDELRQCIERALARALKSNKQNLIAFVPAKAGSGATTVAVQVSAALAHDWKKKILLIDADLHSGLTTALLRIEPDHSIVSALEMSYLLDDVLWERLVTTAHGLDILPTPLSKIYAHITPWEYYRLLAFASPRYDFIIADLPEVINDATEAVARRAASVNVVCTPERTSLILARRRIYELERRVNTPDRVRIVVNRYTRDTSVADIEHFLGHRMTAAIPNDYPAVDTAATRGSFVNPSSAVGKSYRRLAAELAGIEPTEAEPQSLSSFEKLRRRSR